MTIRTKLRCVIAVAAGTPVAVMLAMGQDRNLFPNPDFQEVLAAGVATVLVLILAGHLAGTRWLLSRRLAELRRFCTDIRRGRYAPIPLPNEPVEPDSENELVSLARHMNWMANRIHLRERELKGAVDSLETANHRIEAARAALWGEMALARKIQTALLPADPGLPGFEVAARMEPADEVGGDYYDVIPGSGRHWIFIGDVSGHGVTSGLIQMMARTALHAVLRAVPNVSPAGLLAWVNRVLAADIRSLGESHYMTMTALRLDTDGTFRFAGLHQEILLRRAATGLVEEVESRGMWLGVTPDIDDLLPEDGGALAPGDCLLLHTDGVTEAALPDGTMFGLEGLAAILAAHGGGPVSDLLDAAWAALSAHDRADDRTLLVVRRPASGKETA